MFPRLVTVRQHFADRKISDIPSTICRELTNSKFGAHLAPGSNIAIGVGSRGIANIATIVHSIVAFWKEKGMAPFVFPAMGSHGAATAEGQADVLAHYGITEASVGCPIVSRADVVPLGRTADGVEVFMDATAHAANAVMVVARVKWHTTFSGGIESGLMKMLSIGIGKFAGAQKYHAHSQRLGLEHVIRTAARVVLQSGRIVGGLVIVEDAHHRTAHVEAVPAASVETREE